jgi:hypothetical protein
LERNLIILTEITAKAIFLYYLVGVTVAYTFRKKAESRHFFLFFGQICGGGISPRAAAAADTGSHSDNQVHRRKIKLNTIILNSFIIISAYS